jgi:hypothetical protein
VEDEEVIGTLIDTNERIITALEMYDDVSEHHWYGEFGDNFRP